MSDVALAPSEPENQTETTTDDDDAFTLDDVTKRYFSPDQLVEAQTVLSQIVDAAEEGEIKRNFDPEKSFPEGYGLAVIPLSRRGDTPGAGNITIGVAIAAIPDPEMVGSHDKGAEFIRAVITDTFISKVANACRPRADGTTAPTIPFDIMDFLESRRGRESLKAFSEIAPRFVKALRQKGIRYMTAQLLRQTLVSKQFAETQFEKIPQEAWQKVLDGMIVKAKEAGLDPAVLVNWLATRDATEVADIGEIDLDEFDNLV